MIMLYKIYIYIRFYPQINKHWSLQAYLSCSFGLYFCIPLVVCHSGIISSEMSSTYTACVYCVLVLILCILSKNLFLEFLLTSLVIQHYPWLPYGYFNLLHCERPKTTDSLYSMHWNLRSSTGVLRVKYTRRRAPASRYIVAFFAYCKRLCFCMVALQALYDTIKMLLICLHKIHKVPKSASLCVHCHTVH